MSPTRIRPPGAGGRPLGSGFRLRRDLSLAADAQRRFRAAAAQDDVIGKLQTEAAAPLPTPPPRSPPPSQGFALAMQGFALATKEAGSERTVPGANEKAGGGMDQSNLTPLTLRARALYEGGVVQVRAVARLCEVSPRTLYNYVHRYGWRRRRSSVPRDLAKSERQKQRYRERRALLPPKPRGLKARDPQAQARALAAADRAAVLSGAALARAIGRRDAESRARMVAILSKALRDLAIAHDGGKAKRTAKTEPVKRRRPYQWRPMGVPPPHTGPKRD